MSATHRSVQYALHSASVRGGTAEDVSDLLRSVYPGQTGAPAVGPAAPAGPTTHGLTTSRSASTPAWTTGLPAPGPGLAASASLPPAVGPGAGHGPAQPPLSRPHHVSMLAAPGPVAAVHPVRPVMPAMFGAALPPPPSRSAVAAVAPPPTAASVTVRAPVVPTAAPPAPSLVVAPHVPSVTTVTAPPPPPAPAPAHAHTHAPPASTSMRD